MDVVPGAKIGHAFVVNIVGIATAAFRWWRIGLGAGGDTFRHGHASQSGHTGVERIPVGRLQVVRVLVGQQREKALAVVLRDAAPTVEVGLVVVCRVHAGRQQWGVRLLVDELQAQALLMGEGGGIIQHDGIVLAPAAHAVDEFVHQVAALLAGALMVVQVGGDVVGGEFLQDLFLEGVLRVVVPAVKDLHAVAEVLAAGDAVAVAVITIQW